MKGFLLPIIYKIGHPKIKYSDIPYYWKYSLWTVVRKPIRKWFSVVVIPTIPFNGIRIMCYKLCGYKIGGGELYRYALLS